MRLPKDVPANRDDCQAIAMEIAAMGEVPYQGLKVSDDIRNSPANIESAIGTLQPIADGNWRVKKAIELLMGDSASAGVPFPSPNLSSEIPYNKCPDCGADMMEVCSGLESMCRENKPVENSKERDKSFSEWWRKTKSGDVSAPTAWNACWKLCHSKRELACDAYETAKASEQPENHFVDLNKMVPAKEQPDELPWAQIVQDLDLAHSWVCPEDIGKEFEVIWDKYGKEITAKLLMRESGSLLERLERREPLRHEDMDVTADLFAIRFVEGGSNGLAELYVEDDGWYHFKMAFAVFWLNNLKRVAEKALTNPTSIEGGES